VEDGNTPVGTAFDGGHEGGRLGCAVQRHEPISNDWAHAARQGIDPAHTGFFALCADGLAQRLDGANLSRRIGPDADFVHALHTAQLLELKLKRLVLHQQRVAAFALAFESSGARRNAPPSRPSLRGLHAPDARKISRNTSEKTSGCCTPKSG
jgi:hypothetical protein